MPDAFFAGTKQRKRKRSDAEPRHGVKKFARKPQHGSDKVNAKPNSKAKPNPKKRRDEELSDQTDSDGVGAVDDMDLRADSVDPNASDEEEDEDETPAEKRLRLAQLYLESVKSGLAEGEFDAAEVDRELIQARLKQDVLEHSGKAHLFIADSFDFTQPPTSVLRTRGHRLSVTSAVASESGSGPSTAYLFTSGKEGHIFKWDLCTGKKVASLFKLRDPASASVDAPTNGNGKGKAQGKGKGKGKGKGRAPPDAAVPGHTDEVLALALSGDGRYLASAGRDRRVCVWDAARAEWVKSFCGHLGHKDAVNAVSFKKGTNQLYSASADRTLKVYDLTPSVLGYVETLFGHQDAVPALDALRGDTCVSVGARDKTARFWKIVDETQLVFRGGGRSRVREVLEGGLRGDEEGSEVEDEGDGDGVGVDGKGGKGKGKGKEKKFVEGSLESVAMIDETTFVSGGDSGSICLWSTLKKKPVFTQPLAHGFNEVLSESEGVIKTPRWVTALGCLRYSDIFASGSWDGEVRLWKVDAKLKSFSLVGTVPVPGVINSLQLLSTTKAFLESTTWGSPSSSSSSSSSSTSTTTTTQKDADMDLGHPTTTTMNKNMNKNMKKEVPVNPFILVAGVGQEHKLGRWLCVKHQQQQGEGGEGGGAAARNGAVVYAFWPRTLGSSSSSLS